MSDGNLKSQNTESREYVSEGKKMGYEAYLLPSKPTPSDVCGISELQIVSGGRGECPVTESAGAPSEGSDLDEKSVEACKKCRHEAPDLKICSRCKKTKYCSRYCQRSDWKIHKKSCKSGEGEVDNLIEQLKISGDLQTFTLRTGSKITLEEAKVKVEELFPGTRILDKMSDLDYRPAKGVFIGKVTSLHMNVLQYGICITDTDGKRLSVCFKLPGNNTKPYFKPDDFGFETFVCIQGARLHPLRYNLFAREKVCILVTDASTVRVIT